MRGCRAQPNEYNMTREAIQLNPDKVKFRIARTGIPIKQLLDGMNPKTVHRIKAGKNTTMATAHKLASKLGVTLDDLMSPVKADDMDAFLPGHWLYDGIEPPNGLQAFLPPSFAIGGYKYLVDQSPTCLNSPIDKLLEWNSQSNRKIVLRLEDQAFVVEIHYFDYSPGHAQEVVYHRAMACRFFPLARNGDVFKKTDLSEWPGRYVWNSLKEKVLASAEIVSIEGHDYPDDPRSYFPLARFSRGMASKRVALGSRIFDSQYAFRESLLAYLKGLPPERVQSRLTQSGIAITVNPARPAVFNPNWWDDELEIKLNLAWRLPNGQLALAPWRHTSREAFITGIGARNWQDMHLHHMPLRFFSQDDADEDAAPPLFEADPSLSAETFAAINAGDYPALF